MLCGFPVDTPESVERAAETLLAEGVDKVVVTLGEQGAYVAKSARKGHVAGFSVEAVDTTTAGDTFCEAPVAAATLSVTRLGAQSSVPTRVGIDAFLAAQG